MPMGASASVPVLPGRGVEFQAVDSAGFQERVKAIEREFREGRAVEPEQEVAEPPTSPKSEPELPRLMFPPVLAIAPGAASARHNRAAEHDHAAAERARREIEAARVRFENQRTEEALRIAREQAEIEAQCNTARAAIDAEAEATHTGSRRHCPDDDGANDFRQALQQVDKMLRPVLADHGPGTDHEAHKGCIPQRPAQPRVQNKPHRPNKQKQQQQEQRRRQQQQQQQQRQKDQAEAELRALAFEAAMREIKRTQDVQAQQQLQFIRKEMQAAAQAELARRARMGAACRSPRTETYAVPTRTQCGPSAPLIKLCPQASHPDTEHGVAIRTTQFQPKAAAAPADLLLEKVRLVRGTPVTVNVYRQFDYVRDHRQYQDLLLEVLGPRRQSEWTCVIERVVYRSSLVAELSGILDQVLATESEMESVAGFPTTLPADYIASLLGGVAGRSHSSYVTVPGVRDVEQFAAPARPHHHYQAHRPCAGEGGYSRPGDMLPSVVPMTTQPFYPFTHAETRHAQHGHQHGHHPHWSM